MRFSILLLIIFCTGAIQGQIPFGINWQKNYGGSGADYARDILPLSDSGHLVVGHSFSNDGDVSGHHGTTSTSDGWIFRLDANHNIIWQKSVGGTGNDYLSTMIKVADGNYVALGSSYSNDFDLSGNRGSADIWVLKFDINGNILWSKNFGGSAHDTASSLIQLPSGGYMIAGSSKSLDGQVQSTFALGYAMWLFRITETGDFIAGSLLGNYTYDDDNISEDLKLLPDGNIVMSARLAIGDQETDPFYTGQSYTPWLLKFNPQGELIWKNKASNYTYSPSHGMNTAALQLMPYGITVVDWGPSGGIAPNGSTTLMSLAKYDGTPAANNFKKIQFTYGYDEFDGYFHTTILSNHSTVALPDSNMLIAGNSTWMLQTNNDVNSQAFLVRKTFSKIRPEPEPLFLGGSNDDAFEALKRDISSHFIIAGYSNSSDGDFTGNKGGYDAWIVGITDSVIIQKNIITGRVFLDNNNNQQFDAGDKPFNQFKVKSSKSGTDIISFPYDGIFINETDTGNYVTSVIGNPFFSVQPGSHNSYFPDYANTDTVDFAVSLIPGIRDYKVSLVPYNELLPGFEAEYNAMVSNKGTDTMHNKTATLIKSSKLLFTTATPEPDYQSGDTLQWQINSLVPDSTFKINLRFYAAQAPTLNLGDTITMFFETDSTDDITPVDNSTILIQKSEYYGGNSILSNYNETMPMSEYGEGNYLEYTIRFQNTGTDTSLNITILDTLTNKLDAASLEMTASSHPYQLSLRNNNIYEWKFNGIALVDSNRNEPESRGYITFRVKPVTGLGIGSIVSNTASIYFDHNLPVNTGEHSITLTASKPTEPQLSEVKSSYCKNEGAQTISINNLPDAGSSTTVTVLLNATNVSLTGNQFTLNINTLNAGNNTIRVTFTNSIGSSSKEINFEVLEPGTPDITLNASATNVTDQSPAITVSVSNPVHAGSNPLYTFSKDKDFTNIIQAASPATSISIQSSNLAVGDNKIFVKLESSETCYTDKFALDSVLIVKSAPTGIIDPEFPGSKINIGPNPFRNIININGLQRSKSYSLTILNASGVMVWKKQIRNTASYIIQGINFSNGMYWLHITDDKKKKTLGSFSLYHQQ